MWVRKKNKERGKSFRLFREKEKDKYKAEKDGDKLVGGRQLLSRERERIKDTV